MRGPLRSRVRSRDGFRYGPNLGAPSLATPRVPLSRHTRLSRARPPSPRIASSHHLLRVTGGVGNADTRFFGSDCRPTTSATKSRRTDTPCEHPILADSMEPHYAATMNSSRFRRAFYGATTFPLRRRNTKLASRDNPFRHRSRGAASTPQNTMPKVTDQPECRLRATSCPGHRLRRRTLDDDNGLRGPSRPRAKDPPSHRLLPQFGGGEDAPPL